MQVFADAARRVLQAGPFDLPPGSYAIESRIATATGEVLGTNRWAFTITPAPTFDEELS